MQAETIRLSTSLKTMMKSISGVLLLSALLSCSVAAKENTGQPDISEMNRKNTASLPSPCPGQVTVVGAAIEGKANRLVAGHTAIPGHDRLLVRVSERYRTRQDIRQSKRLSINFVNRMRLADAGHSGNESGAPTGKAPVFAARIGENGSPVIDASPRAMECQVVDVFQTDGFDNFICAVVRTHAAPGVPDSMQPKPVPAGFPPGSCPATEEAGFPSPDPDRHPGMGAKLPMAPDGIVRLSTIEVYPEYLDDSMKYATEVGETSLRTEPGVLTL